MSPNSTFDKINHIPNCIFSNHSIADLFKIEKCYVSPMFQKILVENSHGFPLPEFLTKEENDRSLKRIQIIKNLYAYEKQYGVDCDFFRKPTEGLWSVLKRMKGGEEVDQKQYRRSRSPTARNHSVEKPAPKAKVDNIDPERKKKVFPHFRLTTGETIVFNEDIGAFHEVETPENIKKNKCKGIVPDSQRDRAGGKSKENKKRKNECAKQIKTDSGVQTSDSCESIVFPDKCCEVVHECRSVKRNSTPPKKNVSYENRVRLCSYQAPEHIEYECIEDTEQPENDFIWKSEDSASDCSSFEDDSLRCRTESEFEIQERMLPLMEKYGAAYIARKILVIGKMLEKECEVMKRKRASRTTSRPINQYPCKTNIECKSILKKARMDPTPFEGNSPLKCSYCQKKNNVNLECKSSGPSRPCMNQQRQHRR